MITRPGRVRIGFRRFTARRLVSRRLVPGRLLCLVRILCRGGIGCRSGLLLRRFRFRRFRLRRLELCGLGLYRIRGLRLRLCRRRRGQVRLGFVLRLFRGQRGFFRNRRFRRLGSCRFGRSRAFFRLRLRWCSLRFRRCWFFRRFLRLRLKLWFWLCFRLGGGEFFDLRFGLRLGSGRLSGVGVSAERG